jgi:hypothetical protein
LSHFAPPVFRVIFCGFGAEGYSLAGSDLHRSGTGDHRRDDQVIFNDYDRLAPSVEEVLPHLGDNRGPYFRHLLGSEATGSAGTAWEWLRERSFADDGRAAEYLDLLLKQRMTEHAVQVWASYRGGRRGDYPDSNILFNGDFENPPTGAALDWRIAAARDEQCTCCGQSSLHVSFHSRDRKTSIMREKRCWIRAGTRLILVQVCRMPSRELVVDHIAYEVGCRFDAQFVKYATFVGADCLAAHVQFGCDLAVTPACRKRQQDLVFLG